MSRRLVLALLVLALGAAALGGAWWLRRQPAVGPPPVASPQVAQDWSGQDGSTWAFEPPRDEFSPDALLDLRHLNEAVAGESGFVRVDAQGDFVRGDGQPIRFWAVNSAVGLESDAARPLWPLGPPDLARHARFLAKRGVNMVRHHRQLAPKPETLPGAALDDIDPAERETIWRAVAAYRREGIYSTISPYWAIPMKFAAGWGIAGGTAQSAAGLLFFDETLQAGYKSWLRQLLLEPNPYTGLPLAQDPSVAILQLQNEDSLLFWTVNHLQGPQRHALEAKFGRFLTAKHGSLEAALRTWQGERADGDAPQAGRLALLNLWELTQPPPRAAGRAARLADQTEFYARTMHDFNRAMVDYLRGELGVRALINAGNWKTGSAPRLGDAERWSYGPGEVDASNHYVGGIHQGEHDGWAIVAGDRYTSDSVLLNPRLLPINLKQTAGRPMLVTESSWVPPNAHGAEGPLLIAAYSSLSGVDGYYWFATKTEGWTPPQSANGYFPSQAKWIFGTPEVLGGFPAAALAYRLGYLKRGMPVVTEQRALDDLWARRTPVIAEEASFDPNRDAGDIAPRSAVRQGVPAEAFLVGPVQIAFGGDPAATRAGPLDGLLGRPDGRLRANTGEIELDPQAGWARIDAPRVQGVAAHFVDAPEHRLSDVRFLSGNAFGAALAVSLDGAPLKTSRRILLQYTTQSRPTGWQDRPAELRLEGQATLAGRAIVSFGRAPWQVVKGRLVVELANAGLTRATALDANGRAAQELALERIEGGVRLAFAEQALYVVLH